jgi:hypothetical protein
MTNLIRKGEDLKKETTLGEKDFETQITVNGNDLTLIRIYATIY